MSSAIQSRSQNRSGNSVNALQAVRVIRVGGDSVLELRHLLDLTRERFGRLMGVSVRAIATVEREEGSVEKLRRPYAEVARLYQALGAVVVPEAIGPWFEAPNEAFGGLKPMEVIERGEIDRLWGMVYRLQSGMPG
jgi:transcriptional regulator with XRE-family HTH domain